MTENSTHKGVNWRWKYGTQVQQQRPESPTVTLTWHACKYKVHKEVSRQVFEGVPLVEFMYLARQVRDTVGDSGLCCCTCVTYFER